MPVKNSDQFADLNSVTLPFICEDVRSPIQQNTKKAWAVEKHFLLVVVGSFI